MIITVSSSQDPRLDPVRLGERQLTTIAQRRSTLAAGRFIAEGDLVVARALAAGCKPEVVLCDAAHAFGVTQGGNPLHNTAICRR